MTVDRESAISAAIRIRDGIRRRDNTDYGLREIFVDSDMLSAYMLSSPVEVKPAEIQPGNPITPEFLRLVGFADPTTNGNVWTIQDLDGRELKYLFVGENPMSDPELHYLDGESDGVTLPAPEIEDDLLALCRLLKFPAQVPA